MPNNNSFTMQAAQGLAGGAIGIGLGAIQNELDYAQQKKYTALQVQANQDMQDYNFQKQLQMWKDTSYGPQVEQLKKAGLNPGLLYGMGGAGGATTGSGGGGGATGATANRAGGAGVEMAGMAMQLGLLKAQKENIEADTENKRANTAGTNVGTEIGKIDLEYQKGSLNDRLDKINSEAIQAVKDIDIKENTVILGRTTRIAQAEKIYQEAIGEKLANILIDAQTKATGQSIEESKQRVVQSEAQIMKWAQEIQQAWTNLDQRERELELKRIDTEIRANYPGLGQVMGNIVNDAIRGLTGGLQQKVNTNKPK